MKQKGVPYKGKMSFFMNSDSLIEYNRKCLDCENECKQSFRATILKCDLYSEAKKQKER